jgi:cellulose 1,4-beta-cellobiosidase
MTEKTAFGDTNTFASKGGLAGMSEAAAAGMVLVMSIWVYALFFTLKQRSESALQDDYAAEMLWYHLVLTGFLLKLIVFCRLDAPYPPTKAATSPGVT